MTDAENRIRLTLSGSRTGSGAIDFDALIAFGNHLRRALRDEAREHSGARPAPSGHPTAADEQASALRLVGISAGSAVLEFEPMTDELFAPVGDSLRLLRHDIASNQVSEAVHAALTSAIRSLGVDGEMTMIAPGLEAIRVNGEVLRSLRPTPQPRDSVEHVDGWLHAIDVEPDEIRIRDAAGTDWACQFGAGLKPLALELLDHQVRVVGVGVQTGSRGRIKATDVHRLASADLGLVDAGLSSDDVIRLAMAEVGITAPQELAALEGGFDDDDPEVVAFYDALRAFG